MMLPITHNSYVIPGVDGAKLHAEAQERLAKEEKASIVHAHKLNTQCNNDCVEYNNGYPICPQEGCEGDARYSAPGRGHKRGCTYPNV